ncbi:MAG: sugar phosphate isomerase/epimerase family protein [Abditibacteriaceae bacterium]
MQVGITQIILPKLSTREFAAQAAAAGYEVVELSMTKDGNLNPNLSDAEFRSLSDDIRAAGVEPVSMVHGHCSGNLLDSGDAQRISIEETCKGLQAAATMGIGCTLHTLGGFSAELYYDDAYKNAVKSLKEIAKTAESLKVKLAVEFVWNGFLFSPLEMRRFLDEIDSDYIGFYFDPGNMAVFQFPQHWVRIVGHRTKMVHLKDWKGSALNCDWPPLLEGDVDFAAVNKELRAIGYDGPMISEVDPDLASIEDTAKAIRKIITM